MISLFEVGPRDGLQNESKDLSLPARLEFMAGLASSGIKEIELGAFVRPDRVPQMNDTDAVCQALANGQLRLGSARPWFLVPNLKGLERAQAAGIKNIAVFTAASDQFNQSNIGMSTGRSLEEIRQIVKAARKLKMLVRGYVSTAFGCPFEGKISSKAALKVIGELIDDGVWQVSIGDTIGISTPKDVEALLKPALRAYGAKKLAVHFHDTRGTALANALRALDMGIRTFDSSAGGLGGCPFAPGATGNLATEDLVYLLEGMGIKTGINLEALCRVSLRVLSELGKIPASRYLQFFASKQKA